ncbi:BlaI/MecI/CopY family transcriptional regulator [Paenibacillus psychroresistens]|uniref:BlaI/MecI/CopY family transcriptional regulator n=1 Tax=Paenibacillus psychroresistens TaxID=1778678 RepID=A0A6B8RCH3_9BACL|nr:BlaI/MecI/CopY family transcriptional regulator [Paenibacillus psychroresistens]QGQ93999.1 BlaI/MecI/CopY family transcriptional regulator [Paenibacillus psychroresistens]
MKEIPKISEAEWEVMKILWTREPLSSSEIVTMLEGTTSWKAKTIKTLISRLVQKKALSFKEEGRSYSYYTLVTQEECLKAESQTFLKRIYGGALKPMLVHFLQEEKLSLKDIEELKSILENKTK